MFCCQLHRIRNERGSVSVKISLENITAVATDGAPAMVGRYRGFAALLKQNVPDVLTIHCILHRSHLVAKKLSGELHDALTVCVKAINKIKAHPLNSRLFAKLCEKMMKLPTSYSFTQR